MVLKIAGGGNAREKQPCFPGAQIGNFAQRMSAPQAMISYTAGSRISFAPT
ncbi:hypothetical protein [Agrobacterium sp. 22-226-1]